MTLKSIWRITLLLFLSFTVSSSHLSAPPNIPCMADFQAALLGPSGTDLIRFCDENPGYGFLTWSKLYGSGIENSYSWLTRTRTWLDEGLTLIPEQNVIKLKSGANEIGFIENGTLLANRYRPDFYDLNFSGNPVGDIVNGCQVFKKGNQILVKRVPDKTGFTTTELDYLRNSGGQSAHCLERHGFDVSEQALIHRARTGITPDGRQANVVDATRFHSANEIKSAITMVGPGSPAFTQKLNSNPASTQIIFEEYDTGINLGYGYKAGSATGPHNNITTVTAIWRKNQTGDWYLVTMYPHLLPI